MFGRVISDKLPESLFENFESFKIFKKHKGDLSQKLPAPNMWLLVNYTKPKKHFVLKLIYFKTITNQQASNYKITPLTVQC